MKTFFFINHHVFIFQKSDKIESKKKKNKKLYENRKLTTN